MLYFKQFCIRVEVSLKYFILFILFFANKKTCKFEHVICTD